MLEVRSEPRLANPMVPAVYTVHSKRRETHDTVTLEIAPHAGGPPPTFAPGQFNMLYVFGVGEIPVSISGDPTQTGPLLHTIRAVGAVSTALCGLRRGDTLGVRGPFGSHWPVEEAEGQDVLIAAGGIGLAPLRPALYHLQAHRERYGSIALIYGARTPADLLYPRQLEKLRARFDLDVEVTVDRGDSDWRGEVGVVTTLIPHARFDPTRAIALLCGPEIMMRFTVRELQKAGMTGDRIYLSMERNMKCAIGLCGHCQFGPRFVCTEGPVFRYDRIEPLLAVREL